MTYDWRGRYIERDDDPPLPKHPRCDCGAYVGLKPTFDGWREYSVAIESFNPDDPDEIVIIGHDVQREYVTEWTCKRCGRDNPPDTWRN